MVCIGCFNALEANEDIEIGARGDRARTSESHERNSPLVTSVIKGAI